MEITKSAFLNELKMIRGVEGILPKTAGEPSADKISGGGKPGFADFLMNQLKETNDLGVASEQSIAKSLAGEGEDPHRTMILLQKASISMTLLMSVKERLERAYQELMRLQA